jgi:hypothetical protein
MMTFDSATHSKRDGLDEGVVHRVLVVPVDDRPLAEQRRDLSHGGERAEQDRASSRQSVITYAMVASSERGTDKNRTPPRLK